MRPVVDPAPVRTGRIRTLVRLEFVGQTMPVARKLSDHTLYHVLAQSRLAAQLMRSSISSVIRRFRRSDDADAHLADLTI